MFVSFASSYTLCDLSAQSELGFSPNCLVGSAEMILPVCGIWVTGQEGFSLTFENIFWNMSIQVVGLLVKSAR